MSDKKVKVTLTDVCSAPDVFECSNVTEAQAEKCARHLSGYKQVPKDSCINYMNILYVQSNCILTALNGLPHEKYPLRETYKGELKIAIILKKNCKCNPKNCFSNIVNGKCTDDFANGIIYDQLFKDEQQR